MITFTNRRNKIGSEILNVSTDCQYTSVNNKQTQNNTVTLNDDTGDEDKTSELT